MARDAGPVGFPVPPSGAGPQSPPTTTGQSRPSYPAYPPWQAPFRPPPPAIDPLLSIGGVLATVGGLIIGIGWLIPLEIYWVVLGVGWLMFGPGVGMCLIGLGRQRTR